MRIRFPVIMAAVAALSAGCAMGPDYKRPADVLPAQFAPVETGAPQGVAVADQWWRAFGDAELDALVERALRDSSDVRIALARIEQADAVMSQAGAALFPEVDLNGNASRISPSRDTWTSNKLTPRPYNDFKLTGLMAAYELDFWGKFRRAREAAIAQAAGSRYYRDTVRLSLAGGVASGYLTLRSLDTQLASSQASLKTRETAAAIAQRRYDAGKVSALDVQQAESARAALEAQVSLLTQQRALQEHQLGLLVGAPDLSIAASDDVRKLPLPPVPPAGLPADLLDRRPDVRQAEQSLISYNAQIGVAKAALFPSISLTGALGGESFDLSNLFNSGARIWSASAVVNLPVFDAGYRLGKLDQATAVQKEALEQYRKTAQTAYREVLDALVTLRQSAVTEKAREAQLSAAEKAERIARARYDAGSAAFIDLLDAQRSTNDVQIAFIQSRETRLNASIALFKALGGGWKAETIR
ncbi:efflux transporter outer membrane subunit [Niveibacterium umoris]|uniref:Multidrug efflux system outer membrane protein n=1 Tax=Niveibacterium umoris TaxID=1193620 RepID=A0A840BFJ8_9RHOO|nr:efflux transporter outer membrane subunit [Niveibacterium umoris]MBB4011955.1 multidrug efflux system outer membrane protein [Niveibacterium umoris]